MEHEFFGISIDDLDDNQLHERLVEFFNENKTHCIATPNAEMIIDALHDHNFAQALNKTDLKLPDGVAVRFAISALTNSKLKHRHTGVDSFLSLVDICAREEKKILLFGACDQVLELARMNIVDRGFVHIDILNPGAIDINKGGLLIAESVIKKIKQFNPDVIAIALSHKKQILFMDKMKNQFPSVKIIIGIGGALDMISGQLKRAPKIMSKIGLEWAWRVLIEPSRIGRIMNASIIFPIIVISEAIQKRILIRATIKTIPEIFKQLLGR